MSVTRGRVLAFLLLGGGILLSSARAQVHDSEPYDPINWASTPPEDCPFEPSKDVVGITFTGSHREYANSDCWNPSWASDGNMYSCYSDGSVENVLPDGTRESVHAIGNKRGSLTPRPDALLFVIALRSRG